MPADKRRTKSATGAKATARTSRKRTSTSARTSKTTSRAKSVTETLKKVGAKALAGAAAGAIKAIIPPLEQVVGESEQRAGIRRNAKMVHPGPSRRPRGSTARSPRSSARARDES